MDIMYCQKQCGAYLTVDAITFRRGVPTAVKILLIVVILSLFVPVLMSLAGAMLGF
jgi:hypothetical protein